MKNEMDKHVHDENCNHDHEEEIDVIYLTFEDDEEVECQDRKSVV